MTKTHGATIGESRGGSCTKEYRAWKSMKSRGGPNNKDRFYYYDRGIRVCERWQAFEFFLKDVGYAPSPHHTLDRIDNNKGYEPGNVRWATRREQNFNNRRTRMMGIGSNQKPLKEWCELYGRSYVAVSTRLNKHGWTWPNALYAPVKNGSRKQNPLELWRIRA